MPPKLSAHQFERKREVLTHSQASIAESIMDAAVMKNGNLVFVSAPNGEVPIREGHGLGLYYIDCRFLNGYEIEVAQQNLIPLASVPVRGNEVIFQLTNAAPIQTGQDKIEAHELDVRWKRCLTDQSISMEDTLTFENFGRATVDVPVNLEFRGQFEDIFAIRGLLNRHRGKLHTPRWHGDGLRIMYDGADGIFRGLEIGFGEAPTRHLLNHGRVSYSFSLRPRETKEIKVTIKVRQGRDPAALFNDTASTKKENALRDSREEWLREWTQISSDNPRTNRLLKQSFGDLHTLLSKIDGSEFFAAGVPWFVTLFGRDSLLTSYQCLAYNPKIAKETLTLLAKYQGTKNDDWRDEAPGKILHELRRGELANLNEIPHTPYYGSSDATPLFLILMGRYVDWTGDLEFFRTLRPNVDAALHWISETMAGHPMGYLAYSSAQDSKMAMVNQGWKDSGNAIVNPDGSLAQAPIALVEIQAYVYQAQLSMARLLRAVGERAGAEQLEASAKDLRVRFNRDFWDDQLGTYLLALQKDGKPVNVVTSNPGHALWGGIADMAPAQKTGRRLMADDMFNGWGIRTLSAKSIPYNPLGYHLGTVWPHDNSLIMEGLKLYDLPELANEVFLGIWEAAANFEFYRLPEAFAGFARADYEVPVKYPVACHPQAWAAGSLPYMVSSLLGLRPDALAGTLRIVRPSWPERIQNFELRNLRVGRGSVDLRFELDGASPTVKVLKKTGDLKVILVNDQNAEIALKNP